MIEVELPDGVIAEFPDGTSQEVIKGALQKRFPAPPSMAEDVAKSGASGLAEGTTGLFGFVGDAMDLSAKLGRMAGAKLRELAPPPESMAGAPTKILPDPVDIIPGKQDIENAIGFKPYQPQTTAGEYARTVGQFLPGGAALGGGRRLMSMAIAPAIGSEAAGQATEGTAYEPYARIGGAVGGAFVPGLARRAVTPFPAGADRLRAVETMRKEGVDLTAGQKTGSQRLRYMESELGGLKGEAMMERQAEQFTKAALSRAGINANRATPEVIDGAFSRIGRQFDDLAARNDLAPVNHKLADDLVGPDGVMTTYRSLGGDAPIIEKTILDIGQRLSANHVLTGDYYKSVTSRLARLARGATDPELKQALQGIRDALDDAMEQSIARANPRDLGAWREARRQYRNMIAIERAATGAGENAAAGLISPSQLRNATVQKHGRRSYARGQGDFADLARSGEATMKPLPQSGTAPRIKAQNLGAGILSLIGGGAGGAVGGGPGAMAGMLAGAAAPPLAGRAMLSGPGRAYLGNQVLRNVPKTPVSPVSAALIESGLISRPFPDMPPLPPYRQ